jgi:hypothetical protein
MNGIDVKMFNFRAKFSLRNPEFDPVENVLYVTVS